MKKIFTLIAIAMVATTSFAESEEFRLAMEKLSSAIETAAAYSRDEMKDPQDAEMKKILDEKIYTWKAFYFNFDEFNDDLKNSVLGVEIVDATREIVLSQFDDCKYVVVKDGEYQPRTYGRTTCNIKYTRKFNGKYQALYVPFEFKSVEGFTVYKPTSYNGQWMTIEPIDFTTNTDGMYIIKAEAEGEQTIEFKDVKLRAANNGNISEIGIDEIVASELGFNELTGTIPMVGTDLNITYKGWYDIIDATQKKLYAISTEGEWVETNVNRHDAYEPADQNKVMLQGQRWFIELPQTSSPARFAIVEDGDATAINAIEAENATSEIAYNLNGQRVSANAKGLVIKNGKKFFVK